MRLNKFQFKIEYILFATVLFISLAFNYQLSNWWILGIAAAAVSVMSFFSRRGAVLILAVSVLSVVSIYLRTQKSAGHYLNLTYGKNRMVQAVVEIADMNLTDLPDIYTSKNVIGKFRKIRFAGENWQDCHGKIMVYFQEGSSGLRYGDILLLNGVLRQAKSDGAWEMNDDEFMNNPGFGDYEKYLRSQDIFGTIFGKKFQKIGYDASFLSMINQVRNKLLEFSCRRIEPVEFKNLTAALFFGCKSAISPEVRYQQIRSGTIHLFAVSGLHVGMLFAMLLWFFCYVNYRYRYLLAGSLTFLYVLSTGANVPALRAFLMILIWSVLKSFFRKISSFNVLILSGAILMVFNPYYITDVGFLYSFTITAALILAADRLGNFSRMMAAEQNYLVPGRRGGRKFWDKVKKVVFFSLITCVVAFLGGSFIGLATFGTFYPAALAANILVLPLIGLLFDLMALKLLLFPLGFLDGLLSELMEILFKIFDAVSGFFSSFSTGTLAVPFVGVSLLFYLFFFGLFFAGKLKKSLWLIGILPLFGLWVGYQSCFKSPFVLVASESVAEAPVIVIAEPKINYAVAINCNSPDGSLLIQRVLSESGVKKLNLLLLPSDKVKNQRGVANLDRNFQMDKIIYLKKRRNPAAFNPEKLFTKDFEIIMADKTGESEYDFGNFKFFAKKNGFSIEYFNYGTMVYVCINYDARKSELTIANLEHAEKLDLPNSSIMEYKVYELR